MEQKDHFHMFELLAPAGSPAILTAVIKAGADAVYLGGDRYGARAYAENFTTEQLLWALDYAHIRGRKIYLTVNTLLKNEEIAGLCDYIAPLYEHGLDAVLVQDFGVLHLLRETFCDLPIHASTQMTLTGADGVRFLQQQGVQRAVLSRELSLKEAARIHEETGMELEVFVHGALCYCYSGQCLFSGMLGGRSGNRGRCAQPCRLPYTVSDEDGRKKLQDACILSMKDLCGIEDLAALHQAGVYSLKIEGRMKQEAYAAGVVSFYRKYIDRFVSDFSTAGKQADYNCSVTREDKQAIANLGNRCGFTDGYYRKRNGSDMITYDRPGYTTGNTSEAHDETDKIEITGSAAFRKGLPAELTVCTTLNTKAHGTGRTGEEDRCLQDPLSVTVMGQVPDKAQKAPVTAEDLRLRLMKTGDSPFSFTELTVDADEDIFIPNGAVNRLRRDAMEELEKALLAPYRRKRPPADGVSMTDDQVCDGQDRGSQYVSDTSNEPLRMIALVSDSGQLAAVLADGRMTDLYLETVTCPRAQLLDELSRCLHMIAETGQEYTVYLALPPIFRQHTREFYTSIAAELAVGPDTDIRGFLVRNYEELAWAGEHFPQAERIIDHHLYTYNDVSSAAFLAAGAKRDTVPLELNRAEIFGRDNRHSEMVIYGRYPLMLSAQCAHANAQASDRTKSGCDRHSVITTLTDRRGVQFPVCNFCSECQNVIYNSVPTVLFGRMHELAQKGIRNFRLEFTIESPKEVSDILAHNSVTHTNGHYTRGVE